MIRPPAAATIADSDLISACRCGDNNALRKALRDGANINGTDAVRVFECFDFVPACPASELVDLCLADPPV